MYVSLQMFGKMKNLRLRLSCSVRPEVKKIFLEKMGIFSNPGTIHKGCFG